MAAALLTLIGLQIKGFFRRILRGASSPRRAIFLLIGLAVLVFWMAPGLFAAMSLRGRPSVTGPAMEHFRDVAPVALLGICLMTVISSASDKAVAFTAGEVDVLFPGPFTRRQLLGYKLLKSAMMAVIISAPISIALLTYARSWLACWLGVFLMLQLIQLFSTAAVLLIQAIGSRAHGRARRGALIAAVLIGLLLIRGRLNSGAGADTFYAIRYSPAAVSILQPFEPFARTITADGESLARYALEAALIDCGLLAIVVLLDANYMEAALAASRRRQDQLQRLRRGALMKGSVKSAGRLRLPMPARLGGAGPVFWRQAVTALRSAPGLLKVLLLIALCIGPFFAATLRSVDIAEPLIGVTVWITVLLSGLLKFDFRGDLDHMAELKTLPIRPLALAAGQLAVPVLLLSAIHMLLLLSVASVVTEHRAVLVVAACLALPFNGLLMTTENLIFLLFPSRPAAATVGDFQVIGRQVAQLIVKSLVVVIGCAIAAAVAVPFYIVSGGSAALLTIVAGAILCGEICALMPAVARAFGRFDPALDTPA